MIKSISVNARRQIVLPKGFWSKAKLKPGSRIVARQVGDSLLLSSSLPSPETEIKALCAASGLPSGLEPKGALKKIQRALATVRSSG